MENVMRTFLAAIVAFACGCSAARAESVTGSWSYRPCKVGRGAITVSATAISGDINCTFASVRRSGNIVRWQGTCYSPEGDARGPGEMVAVLRGGKLTLSGFGLGAGPLTRCRR
jgi:hypothetical protein